MELWNGQRPTRANGAPFQPDSYWLPKDVITIEYYDDYRKVPSEYSGLAWPIESRQGCRLIVYWLRGSQRR